MTRFCGVLVMAAVCLAAGCKKKEDEASKSAPTADAKADPTADPTAIDHGKAQGKGTGGGDKTATGTKDSKPGSGKAPAAAYCGADPCPCKPGSENQQNDKLIWCELEQDLEIQGVACAAGQVHFQDDGKLRVCTVTAEMVVDGFTCKPAPLAITWHANGKLDRCTLAREATVGPFTVPEGQELSLHDDGTLRSVWGLKAPVTVDGFECASKIYTHRSGKLMACTLAAAAKVGDQEIPAGSFFRITEDGALRGLELGADATVAGKKAKQGDRTCFEDGKPSESQGCWMF